MEFHNGWDFGVGGHLGELLFWGRGPEKRGGQGHRLGAVAVGELLFSEEDCICHLILNVLLIVKVKLKTVAGGELCVLQIFIRILFYFLLFSSIL